MKLNALRTGTRQALAFGLVIALMALVVGITLLRLQALDRATTDLLEREHRAAAVEEWRALTQLNATRALAIAKSFGAADVTAFFEAPIKDTSARIGTLQDALSRAVHSERGQALLAAISARRSEYLAASQQVLDQTKAANADAARQALNDHMVPASQAYVAAIEALAQQQKEQVAADRLAMQHHLDGTQATALALLALGAAVAAAFGWLITRSITVPLRHTVQATEAMAAGDLTHPVTPEGRDEMAQMLRSLGAMQDALRRVIGEVRAGSDSMSTASEQIASGNQDLSGRTEQTASNLQQAASSLEQLTGTVRQTADSART
ncbi:MAG: HAMP domain-containing protein, partial [Burkholderiales bacterium]|nr:HAMP domain-containing protein [Burkholderiales bacterium]